MANEREKKAALRAKRAMVVAKATHNEEVKGKLEEGERACMALSMPYMSVRLPAFGKDLRSCTA